MSFCTLFYGFAGGGFHQTPFCNRFWGLCLGTSARRPFVLVFGGFVWGRPPSQPPLVIVSGGFVWGRPPTRLLKSFRSQKFTRPLLLSSLALPHVLFLPFAPQDPPGDRFGKRSCPKILTGLFFVHRAPPCPSNIRQAASFGRFGLPGLQIVSSWGGLVGPLLVGPFS